MVELNAGAPKITDRLCDACAEHFAGVRAHLDALGIAYRPRPGARPRARLLHPDDVRVLPARTRRGSSRRSAAAGATTGSSSCSAAGRRRGSGSGLGSTGSCSPSRPQGLAPHRPSRDRSRSSSARTRPTRPSACGSPRSCGRPARRAGGSRRRQARPAARGGREGRRPLRDHPRRRARRRPGPAQGPPGGHPAARRDHGPGARAVPGQRLPPPRLNAQRRRVTSARRGTPTSLATPKKAWEPW